MDAIEKLILADETENKDEKQKISIEEKINAIYDFIVGKSEDKIEEIDDEKVVEDEKTEEEEKTEE